MLSNLEENNGEKLIYESFGSLKQNVSKELKQTLNKEVGRIKNYYEIPLAERTCAARAAVAAYEAGHDNIYKQTTPE
jgi:hypothetical protein